MDFRIRNWEDRLKEREREQKLYVYDRDGQ